MLDDRSRFLRVRRRGADPRQESLAAVLDWSFGLLEPVEQQVFARLGIFESSFSEDTGATAAADDSIDRLDVAEAIWALADHSLLTRVESENETRYRMLGTVQAYANQQLDTSEELGAARRLAERFLSRLGPAVPVADQVMDEMRVEIDNLRALIPLLRDEEPETAQLLALSILRFLDDDGDYVSGVQEADLYVSDLPAPTNARPLLLARAARSHHRVGDLDTEKLLDEAQRLREDVGAEPEWASGTIGIERVERLAATGQIEAAIAMATDALQGDLPDRGRVAWLVVLGIHVMGDDPGLAVAYLEEGLSITPEDQPADVMVLHSNVAEALMRVGEHARAAEHQLEALRIAAQLGMSMFVAVSLILAARLRAAESSWGEAIRLHAAADRVIFESGAVLHPDDVVLSDRMLAEAGTHVGDAYDGIRDGGYQLMVAEATVEGLRALEDVAQA
jgi:tetratricopeptide (TPR) repeat protein